MEQQAHPDTRRKCPGCGWPAMHGHVTCGRFACDTKDMPVYTREAD